MKRTLFVLLASLYLLAGCTPPRAVPTAKQSELPGPDDKLPETLDDSVYPDT